MQTGIVTFYRYNYGGFLQAYALQKTMADLGYACEIIQYDYMHDIARCGGWSGLLKRPLRFAHSVAGNSLNLLRKRKFHRVLKRSAQRHLIESKRYTSVNRLLKKKLSYALCISGSDQVFNPMIHPEGFRLRLLEFEKMPGLVRVSYAASMGSDTIPARYEAALRSGLKRFAHISVREKQAVDRIGQYTDRPVLRHVDPTFLLTREEWLAFARKPKDITTSFLFVHQLAAQADMQEYANGLSAKLGVPVINSDTRKLYNDQLRLSKPLSPEEFVWCIENAEHVVTNSFHALALSINLKKGVRVFIPEVAPGRLRELISEYKLERLCQESLPPAGVDSVYSNTDSLIERDRHTAIEYLRSLKDIRQ